jgi:transaldolase
MPKTKLQELSEHGQSVWLDYLSRDILESGKLAEMMDRDAVVGVTSNPTIFQKALASGNAYDEQLKELLGHEDDLKEIFLALSAEDVKGGLELLRPIYDASDGEDGYVS